MVWRVTFYPAFELEFLDLPEAAQDAILAKAGLLQRMGPGLGRPHVDTLKASRHPNMKELRCHTRDGEWRVAFVFDPDRDAVCLWPATRPVLAESAFTDA